MIGLVDKETQQPNRKLEHCLERLCILNADHGTVYSTAVSLRASSTLTDPLSCLSAALMSTYGPLHEAADEMAYEEFKDAGSVQNGANLTANVKAKKIPLFGDRHCICSIADAHGKLARQLIEKYMDDFEQNFVLQIAMEIDWVAGWIPISPHEI